MSDSHEVQKIYRFVVDLDAAGMRLDRFLGKQTEVNLPHPLIAKLVRKGKIRINQNKCQISTRLEAGQSVEVQGAFVPSSDIPAKEQTVPQQWLSDFNQWVIFEDADCLVINKPAGLAVQGGSKVKIHIDGILRALKARFQVTPKLVHRLDKETSGVLVFAKNDRAARHLTEHFREKEIQKTYLAIVTGVPRNLEGTIELFIAKQSAPQGEIVQQVKKGGQYSHTFYQCLDRASKEFSLMQLVPTTGRTHQLRVHMQSLGIPILGDFKYGCKKDIFDMIDLPKQLYLHAWSIRFVLPSGRQLTLEAPLPSYFKKAIAFFQFEKPKARNL